MPKFGSAPLFRSTDRAGYRSAADAILRRGRVVRVRDHPFFGTRVRVPIRGAQRQIELLATRKRMPISREKATVYKSIVRYLNASARTKVMPTIEDIVATVSSNLFNQRTGRGVRVYFHINEAQDRAHAATVPVTVEYVRRCYYELVKRGLIKEHKNL